VAEDENYLSGLKALSKSLELEDIVSFEGPVPYGEELVDWYRRCAVHVNLTPAGFGDKVALEAMSCGALCIVANEGYRETLGDAAEKLRKPLAMRQKSLFFAPATLRSLPRSLNGH
jgi:glycosyltransferase involved in cell wall biosynthesis